MSGTVICGGPRSGKTTLSHEWEFMERVHTDDIIKDFSWSEASDAVSDIIKQCIDLGDVSWVIEGTIAVRGLRKFLKKNEGIKPCDKVVYCQTTHEPLTSQQQNMSNGCWTIFQEIEPELKERGVEVEIR